MLTAFAMGDMAAAEAQLHLALEGKMKKAIHEGLVPSKINESLSEIEMQTVLDGIREIMLGFKVTKNNLRTLAGKAFNEYAQELGDDENNDDPEYREEYGQPEIDDLYNAKDSIIDAVVKYWEKTL